MELMFRDVYNLLEQFIVAWAAYGEGALVIGV